MSPRKINFELVLKSTYLNISVNRDFDLNKSEEVEESEIIDASSTINKVFFILLIFNLVSNFPNLSTEEKYIFLWTVNDFFFE